MAKQNHELERKVAEAQRDYDEMASAHHTSQAKISEMVEERKSQEAKIHELTEERESQEAKFSEMAEEKPEEIDTCQRELERVQSAL